MPYAVSVRHDGGQCVPRYSRIAATLLFALMMLLQMYPAEAQKKPKPTSIKAIPTVDNLTFEGGQFLADGFVTATIKGQTFTARFQDVPVNLGLAADQSIAQADCPILDLELGPIVLNLLGLVVETSPICLQITAHEGEGLLGDLLCAVAHLLDGGLSLTDILNGAGLVDPVTGLTIRPGLTPTQLTQLVSGLSNLLNAALNELYQAVLTAIDLIDNRHTCAILHLELGPLDLNLLGLEVELDDCANGPVTVDITAVTGQGNLLGNLLCQLLDGGLINLGGTLQGLLNQIIGLLSN